jgi:twitching motility protein PilT
MSDINLLLKLLKEKKGSDLHLSPGNPPLCRIAGDLKPLDPQPLTPEQTKALIGSILNNTQKVEFDKTHDLDFGYEVQELESRFRVNVFFGRLGVGAVFRLIPTEIKTLKQLGMPEILQHFCDIPKGLVLVTGATGSGKSTTLAAMVNHINETRSEHILTLEDPIEFVHHSHKSLVNQREVGLHTDSFASALRAALREDPDVILVGEMRDLETIELAITAAETGHLVFGTLHTSSASKTVDRIINVFPTNQQGQIRAMLAESLQGVVSQVLLKNTMGSRTAALEIMIGNAAISNLIRENKTFQIPGVMQTCKKEGMVPMELAVSQLVSSGQISAEEAAPYLSKLGSVPAPRHDTHHEYAGTRG